MYLIIFFLLIGLIFRVQNLLVIFYQMAQFDGKTLNRSLIHLVDGLIIAEKLLILTTNQVQRGHQLGTKESGLIHSNCVGTEDKKEFLQISLIVKLHFVLNRIKENQQMKIIY